MAYSDYAAKTKSEKIVLCHIEPTQRFLLWTLVSGSTYKRTSLRFVGSLSEGTTALTEASSSSLTAGQFFYDITAGEVFVRTTDDSNPNTKKIVAKLKLFYATAPINLPHDLSTGEAVHYEGLLKTNSPITKELDFEQTGIALESNSNLVFENTGGHFDEIYDTLFFEFKRVRLYSWNDSIPLSEKELLFDGIIEDKDFDSKKVKFKCKDFMYKLREPVPLVLFTSSDGTLSETNLATPKRRIYGQVEKARTIPIDNTLEGFTLTGTLSGEMDALTVTGTGTSFLDECSPGDTIIVTLLNEVLELDIESVTSDTEMVISDEITTAFSLQTVINTPVRPWRKKNRRWHISGHKLRQPTTTVASATQPNRLVLTDGTDIFENDLINIDGEDAFVKRISGNNVVLKANLQAGTPSAADVVFKNPISKVFVASKEAFITRDWTYSNTSEAVLILNDVVERNLAVIKPIGGTFTFVNGSRVVAVTGINPSIDIQTRDWIKSSDVTHTTYYEVLSVSDDSVTLRTVYAGANKTDTAAKYKAPKLIEDDFPITVNCVGMEVDGVWIKTASDAVKNLVSVDALQNINADSFTLAKEVSPHILSFIIPEQTGGGIPKIRDVISKINESVIGSLINDGEWNLSYNILTPDRPTTLTPLEDHDIIGEISIASKNQIVRKINLSYRPFVDIFTDSDSFKLIEYENEFVDNFIGTKAEKDITVYLFDDIAAQEIAERYALYNSLSQSVVTVKAKLGFMLNNLNDKVYLNLDRLYKRFGGNDRRKIGIISKITKNGFNTMVEFNDLANVFNRVFSVADDASADFTSADNDAKIVNGYVLDNNLEIPDTTDENYIGSGLIG